MATVELDRVGKVYPNGTRALVDCTLAAADAELLVLVGPSGCGKSTVLRLVAGLEEATEGQIRIGGRVVNGLRPQDRNVAMVFQDYALYPYLTARGNLEFPLRMRGLAGTERQERVARIATMLDIEPLLDRLPKHLSGGQRQRVAMGRALVRAPSVSLLDEPLSNLDARLRTQVRAEIKDLQRRTGTTMLYVTHDQVEAMTLGDRVAVLDRGRLQQVATPATLYAAPVNAFVAGFIGNPPMNLLPAAAVTSEIARGATTIGVRPEGVHLVDGGSEAVRGTVAHVEYLGHEALVYIQVAGRGERLVARVSGMPALTLGAPIGVAFEKEAVHRFDADGRARDPD